LFYLTNLISSNYDVYGICSQFLVLRQPPSLLYKPFIIYSGVVTVKELSSILISSALVVVMGSSLYAEPSFKINPANQAKKFTLNPTTIKPMLFAPRILLMKKHCCSTSMCIFATVKNPNGVSQTYSPKFIGMTRGKCLKKSTEHCLKDPNFICVPKCEKYGAPEKIEITGSPVSFSPKETKSITLGVNATSFYLAGSRFYIGSASVPLIPNGSCIH